VTGGKGKKRGRGTVDKGKKAAFTSKGTNLEKVPKTYLHAIRKGKRQYDLLEKRGREKKRRDRN